jgi:hypothetical protein
MTDISHLVDSGQEEDEIEGKVMCSRTSGRKISNQQPEVIIFADSRPDNKSIVLPMVSNDKECKKKNSCPPSKHL